MNGCPPGPGILSSRRSRRSHADTERAKANTPAKMAKRYPCHISSAVDIFETRGTIVCSKVTPLHNGAVWLLKAERILKMEKNTPSRWTYTRRLYSSSRRFRILRLATKCPRSSNKARQAREPLSLQSAKTKSCACPRASLSMMAKPTNELGVSRPEECIARPGIEKEEIGYLSDPVEGSPS